MEQVKNDYNPPASAKTLYDEIAIAAMAAPIVTRPKDDANEIVEAAHHLAGEMLEMRQKLHAMERLWDTPIPGDQDSPEVRAEGERQRAAFLRSGMYSQAAEDLSDTRLSCTDDRLWPRAQPAVTTTEGA